VGKGARCAVVPYAGHRKRTGKQCPWHLKAERLGRLEVDDQIELGGLLDRDVGRLRATQYLIHEIGGPTELVRQICAVGDQPAGVNEFPKPGHRRQSRCERQRGDPTPVGVRKRVAKHVDTLGLAPERVECGHDVVRTADVERGNLDAKHSRRRLGLVDLRHSIGDAAIGQDCQSAQSRYRLM
jgi:hypothetical protein